MHRTGMMERTPRMKLHKDLFMAQARIYLLEHELDEVRWQNADLINENERLRDQLAQQREIAATCEALGL